MVSVTRITSSFREAGGLMYWAWKVGMDGKDYRNATGKSLGISLHEWMSDPSNELKIPPQELKDKVERCREWSDRVGLEVLHRELSLTANAGFQGRIDLVGSINGRRCLVDWKSGEGYDEHVFQLAGYACLWDEANPGDAIQDIYLVTTPKNSIDAVVHHWDDIKALKAGFMEMFSLYQLKMAISAKLKNSKKARLAGNTIEWSGND